jgi:hypothetical protein
MKLPSPSLILGVSGGGGGDVGLEIATINSAVMFSQMSISAVIVAISSASKLPRLQSKV